MSKYSTPDSETKNKDTATPHFVGSNGMQLPPEAEFWTKGQKKDFLDEAADELVKKEMAAKEARLKAEKLEARRLAAMVKPDDVTAMEKLMRIQDKKIHRTAVYWCAFSPNGERLATCGHDMQVGVWDVIGNSDPEKSIHENMGSRINQVLKGHSGWVMQVIWSPNSKYIATCSADKTIKLWDVQDETNAAKWGMLVTTFKAHEDMVTSIIWHKDNSRIVSACRDGGMFMWDVTLQLQKYFKKESGDALKRTINSAANGNKEGHMDQINRIVYNNSNNLILSASNDTTMKTWNARTGRCLMTFEGHHDHVLSCQFSPDDVKIASASHDKSVRIWDVASGRCLNVLEHHNNIVYDVQFSTFDNGRLLFSVGHDNRIIVYDCFRNFFNCQTIDHPHKCWILSIDISCSNVLIASSSGDGSCLLWQPMHPSYEQQARTMLHDANQCLSECSVM